jgi:hypothetical protein
MNLVLLRLSLAVWSGVHSLAKYARGTNINLKMHVKFVEQQVSIKTEEAGQCKHMSSSRLGVVNIFRILWS